MKNKEILMLKDIYSLGICLLEMMIGRVSEKQYSITIDSLPLTWAELPESTALIQVLVECLNIDSISQRKGKLNNIKRILIKEYKKSFKKSFYNFEHIFTTENPDILNKKAVFSNFRGQDTIAVNHWNEALVMKKTHQDSVVNMLFHRWKSALLTDQDVIELLEKVEAIAEKDSTNILKALFIIAVGEKANGLAILKKVLQGAKSMVSQEESKDDSNDALVVGRDTFKDEEISTMSVKSRVMPIFHRIQLEKDRYFQNESFNTDHKTPICNISISSMSKYMSTSSQDGIIVWSLKSKPKILVKVNLEEPDIVTPTISGVDPKGTMLFCFRRNDNKIMCFDLNIDEGISTPKEPIIGPKEFNRDVLASLAADDSPGITEMYFINEGKTLRLVQYETDSVRFGDYDMEQNKFSVSVGERYEDKSIFKYGLTYVQHLPKNSDTLNQFINKHEQLKNVIVFPESDLETMIVLDKEDEDQETFLIYDIFNERVKRKISKVSNPFPAFAVHHESRFIIYAKAKSLIMYCLSIPGDIDEFIKPIYFSRDHQRNPSRIVKEKDRLCSKIMSLLKSYQLKNKSKKFLIRIRKMMYKCFDKPVLLSYNEAFLTLYKTLLQDDKEGSRIDIVKLHRTMIFNEIKFSNDLNKIKHVGLPSKMENNYLLLSIDGIVHKYDISTKELMFSFKASAYRAMQLFDGDDKILTCDSAQVKIWTFEKENVELNTSLKFEDKIEKFYAPPNSRIKPKYYYVGVFQETHGFKVYKDKLVEHWHGKEGVTITCLDYTISGDAFLAGTTEGKVHVFQFKEKEAIGGIQIGDGSQINHIGVLDNKFFCVATMEPAVYIGPLNNVGNDPYKLNTNPNKIVGMRSSWDQKLVIIGFDDNTIEFWMYDGTKKLEMIKEIKEDFSIFDVDSLCSSMLISNPKGRDIEFHVIEWDWDTKSIEKDLQNINLDFENIKAEDLEDSEVEDTSNKMKKLVSDGKNKKRSQSSCCHIF